MSYIPARHLRHLAEAGGRRGLCGLRLEDTAYPGRDGMGQKSEAEAERAEC